MVLKLKSRAALMATWNALNQFVDNSREEDVPDLTDDDRAEVAAAQELIEAIDAVFAAAAEGGAR